MANQNTLKPDTTSKTKPILKPNKVNASDQYKEKKMGANASEDEEIDLDNHANLDADNYDLADTDERASSIGNRVGKTGDRGSANRGNVKNNH